MKAHYSAKLRLAKSKLAQFQKMHSTANILRTKAEIKGLKAKIAAL